ncbi:glycoside hydrolase family 6 protein [Sphaerisporangium rubeum]
MAFTFPGPPGSQTIQNGWNAQWIQSGTQVTALSQSYTQPPNHVLNAGATMVLGFTATWQGANPHPTAFTLNGVTCRTIVTATPTPTPTPIPTPTVKTPVNPFLGGTGYVNPDWTANALRSASIVRSGTGNNQLELRIYAVAGTPTAVWLDRIAKVTGPYSSRTLVDHLEGALQQRATYVTFVLYDLPYRDCTSPAGGGELGSPDGLGRYRAEFIDPITEIVSRPRYQGLRVVFVVEPRSLASLAVAPFQPTAMCQTAEASGVYTDGIRYAVDRLGPLPNVWLYLDAGVSHWIGYDTVFPGFADRIAATVRGTARGMSAVTGFALNVADYVPLDETFLPDPYRLVGGQPVHSSRFYDRNPVFDEGDFSTALLNAMTSRGFPSSVGMIVDTSRNGWGGTYRPRAPSTSTQVDTHVDQARIDRRTYRHNFCNQAGAGLGERPRPVSPNNYHALLWIKPPGESDGLSRPPILDVDDPNARFDVMCSPTAYGRINPAERTGALYEAPAPGQWHHDQFTMLVTNAYPPI